MSADAPLLEVRNLKKHYPIQRGIFGGEVGRIRAVDGVSFSVERGETLGLVGESGCGKSTAATTMLRLEEPTDGDVLFDGVDITEYDDRELKRFRRRAQMIFQDPTSSFDPRMSIGESVAEPLRIHGMSDGNRRRAIVKDLLERVGMSGDDIDRYPHEFSGGQKQRIALARALSVNPDLIVADEPASALDVSIQADILQLISDLQEEFGLGVVFISHDLGVIRDIADNVAVMYLGEIVETGPTEQVFDSPQHPYTRALIDSIPSPNPRERGMAVELTGDVPSPANPPSGCRFHTRCPEVIQPEGYDFEQSAWRSVMNFRTKVTTRQIDLDGIREFVIAETDVTDPEDVTHDQMVDAIRSDFDIPDTLSDPEAESVLSDALERVVRDEFDEASASLAEAFETVCATDSPDMVRTEAGHSASCHLHDQSVEVEPGERIAQSDD
ncbi:peptide ABC transporter ATP-binding protein [Halobacteriales archaeon QS_8_69_26]|nr:MAG: peptide ABC transporter ATP-binding protein [Halobacteriales archaeon QS_8_69_26]